jgi:hypothetical protein
MYQRTFTRHKTREVAVGDAMVKAAEKLRPKGEGKDGSGKS